MERRKLVAGNWKMYKTVAQSLELAQAIASGLKRTDLDVLVAPTFPAIYPVARILQSTSLLVAAQNLFWENEGAFTGEVSAPLIKAAGATHVLIGHSERRQYFGETERTASRRLLAALTGGLTPILCVGEVLSERESGQTEGVLESQLAGALAGLNPEQAAQVIIAYEPVWAIGSGLTATDDQANQAHAHIRRWMALRFNQPLAEKTKILYGGSVKPANAAGLLSQSEVDGVLVGGASLTAASFLGIIEAC